MTFFAGQANKLSKMMKLSFLLTLFTGLLALTLHAQQSSNKQSVYDAKKRIVQYLNANNTRCTWDVRLYKEKTIDGKTGLYTYEEREIIPPEFKEILGPPYAWFVLAKKTGADKYSLYNLAGTQLTESAYYSAFRIVNNACAVAAFDSTDPACRDNSYIFSLDYLCSYYLVTDSLYQQGILSTDNEVLIPFEYAKITHAGGSRFITLKDYNKVAYDLYDVETQQTLLKGVDDIKVFFVNQAKPIYTGRTIYQDKLPFYAVKANGKWQLLNANLSEVLPKTYDEIKLQDAYVIARAAQLYTVYSSNGDLLIPETPDYVINVINSQNDFIYVTENYVDKNYNYTLFNSNQEELLTWKNGRFLTNRTEIYGYARMVVNEMPKKDILAYIFIDEANGIFLFKDLSYDIVSRKE
jgi:hypothetical protein